MPKCVRKIARSSQKKKSTELARFTAARAAKLAAKIPFFFCIKQNKLVSVLAAAFIKIYTNE